MKAKRQYWSCSVDDCIKSDLDYNKNAKKKKKR